MSFPFLQPYAGLGNSLQTAQAAGGPGGAVGGWVELGRTTLGANASSITVSSLPDKRYYMILSNLPATDDYTGTNVRFNSDSGSNYAKRTSNNGGSDGTSTSQTQGQVGGSDSDSGAFTVHYVSNLASKEKLMLGHSISNSATGAGTAPRRNENVNKWANTSNAINSVTYQEGGGTGNFTSGGELVVLGWDPADTHTTNFWEELASVELGSATGTFSTGTFTAKKYLWLQGYFKANGTSPNLRLRAGNSTVQTGSVYAWRNSVDGGSDSTGTSQVALTPTHVGDKATFLNMFVINNSSNEKLAIGHMVSYDTAGAGSAPHRSEFVGKVAFTSNQLDVFDVTKTVGDNYQAGSWWKVWGSN